MVDFANKSSWSAKRRLIKVTQARLFYCLLGYSFYCIDQPGSVWFEHFPFKLRYMIPWSEWVGWGADSFCIRLYVILAKGLGISSKLVRDKVGKSLRNAVQPQLHPCRDGRLTPRFFSWSLSSSAPPFHYLLSIPGPSFYSVHSKSTCSSHSFLPVHILLLSIHHQTVARSAAKWRRTTLFVEYVRFTRMFPRMPPRYPLSKAQLSMFLHS